MHPFRFAVTASRAATPDAWTAQARRAERLGYSVPPISGHLGPQVSPIAALTAAAMPTSSGAERVRKVAARSAIP